MVRVLFVCLGNICRSPMAEAVFQDLVIKEGLQNKVEVDSAGTGDWHIGQPPHKGTRKKLDEYNIDYSSIKARQFNQLDIVTFDYVIAMDEKNIQDISSITGNTSSAHVARLMDFVDERTYDNVPDPYFTGNFDLTYELIKEGCERLLDFICEQEKL